MSESDLPELLIDDDDEPIEGTTTLSRPKGLRDRFINGGLKPAALLPRLMLWAACGAILRREIEIRKMMVTVIGVPAGGWSDCCLEAAKALFSHAVLVSAAKSTKAGEYAVSDLDLRLAASAGQSLVILSSKGLERLSPAVQASVDHHVEVQPPPDPIVTTSAMALDLLSQGIRPQAGHTSGRLRHRLRERFQTRRSER